MGDEEKQEPARERRTAGKPGEEGEKKEEKKQSGLSKILMNAIIYVALILGSMALGIFAGGKLLGGGAGILGDGGKELKETEKEDKELPTFELALMGRDGQMHGLKISIVLEYEKNEKLTEEKINEVFKKGMPRIKDIINYKLREFVEKYGEEYFTKTVGMEKLKEMIKTGIIGLGPEVIPIDISDILFPDFIYQ